MSRYIERITTFEFLEIVRIAQEIHKEREEPIPSFQDSKINELESCLQTPFMGFGGCSFYKGFYHKAAILFYLLVRNHVLSNGNKRLACLCLSYFCYKNNRESKLPETIFYNLAKTTVLADEENKDSTIIMIEKTLKKYTKRVKYLLDHDV